MYLNNWMLSEFKFIDLLFYKFMVKMFLLIV